MEFHLKEIFWLHLKIEVSCPITARILINNSVVVFIGSDLQVKCPRRRHSLEDISKVLLRPRQISSTKTLVSAKIGFS